MVVVYNINEPTFIATLKQLHDKNSNGGSLFRSILGTCFLNKIHER